MFHNLPRYDSYNWYLYFLNACVEYGYPLITNEYNLKKNITAETGGYFNSEYQQLHEMLHVSSQDEATAEIYTVPDALILEMEADSGSRTQLEYDLIRSRNDRFENYIKELLDEIKEKHRDEDIEGFFVFSELYVSINELAKLYNCPVIAIELTAIRVDAGYSMTLFHANRLGTLHNTDEVKERYDRFLPEEQCVPTLSREELHALFSKESSLPMLPLMYVDPPREILVCGTGIRLSPLIAQKVLMTDDDLIGRCERIYTQEDIVWRNRMWDRDPLDFLRGYDNRIQSILGCRRLVALASNMLLEAMLWNRVACTLHDVLSFSFLCEKDLTSNKTVDIETLNWLIFGVSVPGYLNVLDPNYWRWRFCNPTETEIYMENLKFCLNRFGLDLSIFDLDRKERMRVILQARGCTDIFINTLSKNIQSKEVDFSLPLVSSITSAYCEALDKEVHKTHYCLNRVIDGCIESQFSIYCSGDTFVVQFEPLSDIKGLVQLVSVETIEETTIDIGQGRYIFTGYEYSPVITIEIKDYVDKKINIKFRWLVRSISAHLPLELLRENKSLNNDMNDILRENKSLNNDINDILNSRTWKMTKPIRRILNKFRSMKKSRR
jgi:hypothetical protein